MSTPIPKLYRVFTRSVAIVSISWKKKEWTENRSSVLIAGRKSTCQKEATSTLFLRHFISTASKTFYQFNRRETMCCVAAVTTNLQSSRFASTVSVSFVPSVEIRIRDTKPWKVIAWLHSTVRLKTQMFKRYFADLDFAKNNSILTQCWTISAKPANDVFVKSVAC